MTKKEISDLFDKYEDGYQAWRGDGVMTKGAFIEAVTEALRIHDVVGRSEQLKAFADYAQKRMWEDGDKDLSEFVDEFLRL